MKQFKLDPQHEFSYELSCIKGDNYREMAIAALSKVPDYFWFMPASSSGKYHPKLSLGMGGLVRHVKAVFRVSEEVLNHPFFGSGFTVDECDEIRVAILIHDACKQGFDQEPTHTLHIHPLLPRKHLRPDELDEWGTAAWDRINDLVATHMGPWNVDTKKESDVILELPSTPAQKFVHMCDFIASRNIIEVDVTAREAQLGYKPPTFDEDPTEGQLDFLGKLVDQAKKKGITVPKIDLMDADGKFLITKKQISSVIDELKTKVNSK
jgi:hypothetical protein